jgi:DNA-directed RNA polymerase omega subunit
MYKLPEDLGSKYAFVTTSAKRAEQLQLGARPKIDLPDRKFTVIAQQEIAEGLIPLADDVESEAKVAAGE